MVIILTWLLAGSLDLAAALLFFHFGSGGKPALLLRFISSAAVGPKAFGPRPGMVLLGAGLHYVIALFWTTLYFVICPWLFSAETLLINAVGYGVFIWVFMNLLVLPLSKAKARPLNPMSVLINILILIVAIGLPCAYAVLHFALRAAATSEALTAAALLPKLLRT